MEKLKKVGRTDEIVNEKVLEDIYEMDFKIKNINGNRICIYF